MTTLRSGIPRLIYADITGYGEKGPDADLPGFDITAYWSRSGLLSLTRDAGAPPTWPFAGTGDSSDGRWIVCRDRYGACIDASAPAKVLTLRLRY